jgi:hypothetical protein
VRERERERDRHRARERETDREREIHSDCPGRQNATQSDGRKGRERGRGAGGEGRVCEGIFVAHGRLGRFVGLGQQQVGRAGCILGRGGREGEGRRERERERETATAKMAQPPANQTSAAAPPQPAVSGRKDGRKCCRVKRLGRGRGPHRTPAGTPGKRRRRAASQSARYGGGEGEEGEGGGVRRGESVGALGVWVQAGNDGWGRHSDCAHDAKPWPQLR